MTQGYLPGMESEQRRLDLSQWYTPPDVAERLAEWARGWSRILEPAAGRGALVRAVLDVLGPHHNDLLALDVLAIDADPANVRIMAEAFCEHPIVTIDCADFLSIVPYSPRDVAVMNPPYENDQDVNFILRALKWAPRVVGIFRSAILHGIERQRRLWSQVRLERLAWMSSRPRFGGGGSPESDFIALQLRRLFDDENPMTGRVIVATEWWP